MAIHWTVTFKTLRGGKTLTASIYDSTYSGDPIPLKGADEPFTTEEDGDEDPFKAVRQQSGYLRIVDDGYDANGNAFNWRDLQPKSDHDRPVVLRDGSNNVLWHGFLQAKNFSGTMYEPTQEREFPVQCVLSVLASQYPTTTDQGIVNFAYLLNYIVLTIKTISDSTISFSFIHIQGGTDAQSWLLKKFHWANLLNNTEDDTGAITAKYDLMRCLEDMVNFWGWQVRTCGQNLYLMCEDDTTEQSLLTLTEANLATMAGGTSTGTTGNRPFVRQELSGNIFASDDNDDMWASGPSKAVINADCNEQNSAVTFAPQSVRDQMEAAGDYVWVQGDDQQTGYFTTPMITSFTSSLMDGSVSGTLWAGFCRRQIFTSQEQEKATNIDAFMLASDVEPVEPVFSIQTKRMMSFSNGTLKFGGSVWKRNGWQKWPESHNDYIKIRIGIGVDRASAKWFYVESSHQGVITHGWTTTVRDTRLTISTGDIKGVSFLAWITPSLPFAYLVNFEGIPTEEGMYGYVFVDFLGSYVDALAGGGTPGGGYVIGDFKIEFSREQTYIPTDTSDTLRPREVQKDRVSSMDYTAANTSSIENEWNADLVYASDNNMEYGFGLVMNDNYNYMATADYGDSQEHPEQHFANRITSFWNQSRRVLTPELRTDVVESSGMVTPRQHFVLDNEHYRTLSISHQWRDDVTTIKMIHSTIQLQA